MKRIFVSLSLVFTIGLTTVFANDETVVSRKIEASFQKEFTGAEILKWYDEEEYKVAIFIYRGHRTAAYFDTDGGLSGCARNILPEQLPLAVTKSFYNHFSEADFTDVLEVINPEGTFYWLTMAEHEKVYRIRIGTDGNILQVNKKQK